MKKLKQLLNFQAYRALFQFGRGHIARLIFITSLSVMTTALNVLAAYLSKEFIDSAISANSQRTFYYGITVAVTMSVQLILTTVFRYRRQLIREQMVNELQLKYFSDFYNKRWLNLTAYKTGDLLVRISSDIHNIVEVFVNIFPSILTLATQLILAFSLLFYYDPLLASVTFLITPVTVIFSWFLGRKLKEVQRTLKTIDSHKTSYLNELLHNFLIVKTYNLHKEYHTRIEQINTYHEEQTRKRLGISAKANLILGSGYRLGYLGALLFGGFRLAAKTITFGTFTAFLQLVSQVQSPIEQLSRMLPQIIITFASVERITALSDIPDEIQLETSDEINDFSKLVLEDLSFMYEANKPVLKNIDLNINKGEHIGVIGASGEGKTTLIHILTSLLTPTEGRTYLINPSGARTPLSSHSRSLFSYVPQNNLFFSGSIKGNMKMIKPEATDEEIWEALRITRLDKAIENLPKGIDSLIGENNQGFSQGQVQRLSIARALLRKTPILILDEATSALDLENESAIINNLKTYCNDITLIVISHRPSILEICDKVYEIQDGTMSTVK